MNPQTNRQCRLRVPSSDEMLEAISNRDGSYDGAFFYGVVTTGVFCKPSCASRQAKLENIRIFLDLDSALSADFRACKRCRPECLEQDMERVVEVARHIETHADDRLTLADLSKMVNLSPSRLQKIFISAFGVSPREYQDASRLDRYKNALKQGKTVTDAIYSAGYGSPSRVYGEVSRTMGMTPAAYREGGAEEQIYYAFRESSLGPLLMAATRRGVCFAQFGESFEKLLGQLKAEFPKAKFTKSSCAAGPDLDRWIQALDEHLGLHAPRPDLPLDIRGTAFQLKVWRFLLSVKEGNILSYGELAKEIGKPKAFRAVASACGANRIGILIPCHRVLCGNGDLGGYRWGLDRKRVLLDGERANRAAK